MFSIITLPATAVASTTEFAGTLLTDLWGIIALAIGIPLAFFVIEIIISIPSENEMAFTRVEGGVKELKKHIKEDEKFYNM